MSALKRRCGTCRYFQDAGMGGAGWCTHPKRQVSSDVRILVRPAELACRNSWGVDFWESKDSESATPDRDQTSIDTPDHDIPAGPEPSYDDEVTSVVNAEMHRPDQDHEENDVIVEQSIREPGEDDADDDRFDLLAHGGRDSVNQARERMRRRRQPEWQEDPSGDAPEETAANDTREQSDFAPNDFVEEENPATRDTGGHSAEPPSVDEDVVISENAPNRSPRSRRIRRSREHSPDPKGETERKTEAKGSQPEPRATAYVDERGPFDSVPKVSSEVDLSRLLRAQPAGDHENPADHGSTSTPSTPTAHAHDSYDRALKRAQAIKAAARSERETRQKQQQRPIKPLRQSAPQPEPVATPEPPVERARMSTRDWAQQPDGLRQATPERVMREGSPDATVSSAPEVRAEPPEAAISDQPPREDPRRSWWRGMFQSRLEDDRRAAAGSREMHSAHVDAPDMWEADEQADGFDEPYVDVDVDTHADRTRPHRRRGSGPHEVRRRVAAEAVPDDRRPEPSAGSHQVQSDDSKMDLNVGQEMDNYRVRLFDDAPTRRQRQAPPVREDRMRDEQPHQGGRRRAPRAVQHDARTPQQVRPRRQVVPDDAGESYPEVGRRTNRGLDPVELLEDESDAWYEPETDSDFDVREIVARPIELLDMTIEIAPDVPRSCATCRSYRQSDNSERGWCTNNWAFTHRQMVNATDLACTSTIGCWWLPADEETWLDTAEPDYAPTPRVDRLVAHLDSIDEAVAR